jgi:beta-lactamase superfamily II metal-dependent hydrolase
MHEAATRGVLVVRPQRGCRWTDDGVAIDILAPSLPVLADTGDDINENSIVAMLHYKDFR